MHVSVILFSYHRVRRVGVAVGEATQETELSVQSDLQGNTHIIQDKYIGCHQLELGPTRRYRGGVTVPRPLTNTHIRVRPLLSTW